MTDHHRDSIAQRELEGFYYFWDKAVPSKEHPSENAVLDLIAVFSADSIGEIIYDVVKKLGNIDTQEPDGIIEYINAYALVYYCLGGC